MISLHLSKWIFYFKFLDAMWKSDIPKKKNLVLSAILMAFPSLLTEEE